MLRPTEGMQKDHCLEIARAMYHKPYCSVTQQARGSATLD